VTIGRRSATVRSAKNNISTTTMDAVMGDPLVCVHPTVVGVPDEPLCATFAGTVGRACMTHDDAVEQPGDTVPLVGRESGTTPAA
jgi:hypothetical protein